MHAPGSARKHLANRNVNVQSWLATTPAGGPQGDFGFKLAEQAYAGVAYGVPPPSRMVPPSSATKSVPPTPRTPNANRPMQPYGPGEHQYGDMLPRNNFPDQTPRGNHIGFSNVPPSASVRHSMMPPSQGMAQAYPPFPPAARLPHHRDSIATYSVASQSTAFSSGRPSDASIRSSVGGARMSHGGWAVPPRASMQQGVSGAPAVHGLPAGNHMGASTGRRSSVISSGSGASRNGDGNKGDPRPLRDKAYINRITDEVVQYLLDTGYDTNISRKTLTMPSSKEFFRVCQHLLGRLDRAGENGGFKLGEKPVETVLEKLKQLGYPASISKTAVAQSGTPHAWPQLAGMLHWLVQLLLGEEEEEGGGDGEMGPIEEEGEEGGEGMKELRERFSQAVAMSYNVWVSIDGDDEECHVAAYQFMAEFDMGVVQSLTDLSSSIENKRRMLQEAEQAMAELAGPSPLAQAQVKVRSLQEDAGKLQKHLQETKMADEHAARTNADWEAELERRRAETASLREAASQLAAQVAAQGVSVEEAGELMRQKGRLEEALEAVRAEAGRVREAAEVKEVEATGVLAEVEEKAVEFNSKATSLKLIPSSAKLACGMDLEIAVDPSQDTWAGVLGDKHNDKGKVRAALEAARQRFREKRQRREEEALALGSAVRQAEREEEEEGAQAEEARSNKEKMLAVSRQKVDAATQFVERSRADVEERKADVERSRNEGETQLQNLKKQREASLRQQQQRSASFLRSLQAELAEARAVAGAIEGPLLSLRGAAAAGGMAAEGSWKGGQLSPLEQTLGRGGQKGN